MSQLTQTSIKEMLLYLHKDGEILFIVPPFGSINDGAFGTHLLQVLAEEKGYKTDILYLNILLASILGIECYNNIHSAPEFRMLGERLFARSAYGLPPLGNHSGWCVDEALSISGSKKHVKKFYEINYHFDLDFYLKIEETCKKFIDEVIEVIVSLDYKIIGCTTSMFRQTNCSIALITGIKKHSPEILTIIGGGNCKEEMAEGIASLSTAIDYIFQGESEISFLNFLKAYSSKKLPSSRILTGHPLKNLDNLPLVDYEVFFTQYRHFLGEDTLNKTKIWYETSRGCWWAQRSKCAFCSEHHISYRQKSINVVVNDLKRIGESYPDKMLFMTDISMPHSYHKELQQAIGQKEDFPELAYQLRINLDLKELINLKKAKIYAILPGIETFSTNLLDLMNKGTTGNQSLLFLRNTTSLGIYVDWFLLWGFPWDKISDYKEVLNILPLIRHLQPPRNFEPMTLLRFSPYLNNRQKYKITNVQPWSVFKMIYPDWAEIDKLAAYYTGEYACESHENPEIIQKIANEVTIWKKTWKNSRLTMEYLMGSYIINDNRDIQKKSKPAARAPYEPLDGKNSRGRGIQNPQCDKRSKTHVLQYRQAKEIMISRVYQDSDILNWAINEKLGIVIDTWYVPLVTAPPELLLKFEKKGSINHQSCMHS